MGADKKIWQQVIASPPSDKKHPQKQDVVSAGRAARSKDVMSQLPSKEDALITAIDNRKMIAKYADLIEKLESNDLPVEAFLAKVSPGMALKLLQLAESADSEKVQFEAVREILALAGHTKIQKVAIANVDPNADKRQLKSLVEGLAGKLEDIEIVDD